MNDLGSGHRIYYGHFFVSVKLVHGEAFLEVTEIVSDAVFGTGSVVHLRAGQFATFTGFVLTFEKFLVHFLAAFAWVMVDEVSIPYVLRFLLKNRQMSRIIFKYTLFIGHIIFAFRSMRYLGSLFPAPLSQIECWYDGWPPPSRLGRFF